MAFRNRPVGFLVVIDRLHGDRAFNEEDERLLQAFAASAATAVAIAQTVESQRLRQSLDAAEAERRRWARELHDDTLQALGALKVMLSTALRAGDETALREAVGGAVDETGSQIAGLRSLITELRPAALDDLGVGPALASLVRRSATIHGLEVDLDVQLDEAAGRLADHVETAIYRLVQEALSNVGKHAGAETARIRVAEVGDRVEVEVVDDGVGFDPELPADGFGLVGMRERIDLAGGRLAIASNDPGTRVEVVLPAHARP
jgi:signal transduction histidine kinase